LTAPEFAAENIPDIPGFGLQAKEVLFAVEILVGCLVAGGLPYIV
jgi:hypothetical protein